jgi:hypothetical protein
MLRVCAFANQIGGDWYERLVALERSLGRKGVPFVFNMESGPWSWKRKVEWELEWASRYPYDLFVFVDAFDMLFVGERSELEALVAAQPLVFSCDCGPAPWPDGLLADAYEARRKKESKWCWLNGSGPAGVGDAIAQAASWGLANVPFVPPRAGLPRGGTDQLFWTHVYLHGFGELDQQCRLSQVLFDAENPQEGGWVTPHLGHKDGRVVNLLTGAKPQFIHATGQSWNAIPEELWKPLLSQSR